MICLDEEQRNYLECLRRVRKKLANDRAYLIYPKTLQRTYRAMDKKGAKACKPKDQQRRVSLEVS